MGRRPPLWIRNAGCWIGHPAAEDSCRLTAGRSPVGYFATVIALTAHCQRPMPKCPSAGAKSQPNLTPEPASLHGSPQVKGEGPEAGRLSALAFVRCV